MADSLLTVVQNFTREMGLPVPPAVIGSTDATVAQYLALMQKLLQRLYQFSWQELKARRTFTTIAAEEQGTLLDLIGADYESIVQGSIWDETLRRPLFGPTGDQTWEMYKAFVNTGPLYQYQIFNSSLLINPAPPAGHTIGLIIKSNYLVIDSTSGLPKESFTADEDTVRLPNILLSTGLEWMWKRQKGEPWEDAQATWLGLVANNLGKDANLPVAHLDVSKQNLVPGIWVPAGNWPTV